MKCKEAHTSMYGMSKLRQFNMKKKVYSIEAKICCLKIETE